ncbi:legumain isoform X1 [Pangasianodon hypophthalmus]|uniref:legumain isoform X1 n=1 Tax=Pangasianodon hypophthalmus TaxID=310915 RepID=UPI002306FDD3|nr:legumain isoform X1 [Pangasianodon hypophthalmus]XP_034165379.2 legumain isoform X1 [Pangasianodon hypophthalmus]XP_034165380.2 legumain isoform X1 [Pangasianodon hypophthalmus]
MASNGKQWVLLAAGSKGWENYRHQADVCHAYQVVHQNGIPDEQIVVMMYDDIAHNEENPFPGNIINVPKGPDVYNGVPKDYTGEHVSAENFLAVLRGDSRAIRKRGRKKVIKSCANDSIFIYLSDHGGHGVFQFPNSTLYAHELIDTVKEMCRNGKFSKMVIYMEACHAGSMLDELPKLGNVYAVAASKPEESSYACFFDKKRNAFVADAFTAYWLHHTKRKKLRVSTLEDQFYYVKEKVRETVTELGVSQTPCHYGNMFMLQLPLSEFLGKSPDSVRRKYKSQSQNFVVTNVEESANVPLLIQQNRIRKERNPRRRDALERQYHELKRKQSTMDKAVQKIAQRCTYDGGVRALSEKHEVTRLYELRVVAEHFRTTVFNWDEEAFVFTRSHLQVLVNLCECGLEVDSITAAIDYVGQRIKF